MTKLKLLILGTDEIWSIDKIYYKHLSNLEIDIRFFATENIFAEYYNKSLVNKLTFKLSMSRIYKRIYIETLKVINEYRPDIIWVFKGMSLSPQLLREAKKLGIMMVNYNADNPFIFSGRGSGNSNVTNSIGLYDLHLTYNLEVQEQLKKDYNIKTGFLPFGYEIDQQIIDEPIQEINRLCFIGNPDKYRAKLISQLLDNDVAIDVYGHHWKKYINHKNLSHRDAVYGDELWRTLKNYRLQLNIMRIHNLNSHNMRSFEVPGSGSIMLAPDTVEHRLFFEDKKEVFLYRNLNHCAEISREILRMSNSDAKQIRENAKQRSVHSNYTYVNRAKEALKIIKATYES
ncbi:MAG: glycosyltransferase family 1 protein [Pedobacter sp.]|nr:MAG: glycosyltransferase family 1 protein [Pedobacter sp.]